MSDPRFARLHTDPRFVRPKAAKNKLVLDERFAGLFDGTDGPKAGSSKVDKYGRKRAEGETENELRRYYRVEEKESRNDDEAVGDEDEPTEKVVDFARGEGLVESSDEEGEEQLSSDSDSDSDDGPVTLAPATLRRRPSRSPSIDLSETEPVFPQSDDDSEAELPSDDEVTPDPTRRLAVVNMDWDHLRATDLFRVLASPLSLVAPSVSSSQPAKVITKKTKFNEEGEDLLKGTGKLQIAKGRLLKLVIYQSEFGRERIEREEREGPPKELFLKKDDDDDEDEGTMKLGRMKTKVSAKRKSKKRQESDDESEEEITEMDLLREQIEDGQEDYDGEALRRYQLERLRYYYAIATFDSPASAHHVHTQINGTEFERTANIFDLQFVPDDTTFTDSPIHDEATEATIAAQGPDYQGVEFVTDALRHSKVQLTWDADDPHRKSKITSFLASATDSSAKGTKGKGKELNEDDIRVYLASSSEDEDEDVEEAEDDFFEADESAGKKGKRQKLRSLFGLDSLAAPTSWDGSKETRNDGAMQITFAPALTDAPSDFGQGGKTRSKEEESALETYKRKEKERRERKKAERKARKAGIQLAPEGEEGPEFGGQDVGPGGFDDDFFKDDAGGEVWDGDREFNAGDAKTSKLSKKQKRDAKIAEERERELGQAELALLVDDDDEGGEDGSRHFDMRKILKAEKGKGKKARKGKGKKGAEAEIVKDDFQIDLKDDRFKSLHEDYEFAIDPSNPRFQKTRNMSALLAEGRKRRSKGRDARAPVGDPGSARASTTKVDDGESLRKLVESVKRKASDVGGRGKRAKADA